MQKLNLSTEQVWQLYESGLSTLFIGKKMNCSGTTIGNILRKAGYKLRPSAAVKKDIDFQLLKYLYCGEQLPTREVGKMLQINNTTVVHKLHEAGVQPRSKEQANAIAYARKFPDGYKQNLNGYIIVKCPSHPRAYKGSHKGYILEHILVWETYHHRAVPKGCLVHHLNGIKNDNRPQNLIAIKSRRHHLAYHVEPYKKRIRELEAKIKLLEQTLASNQLIFYPNEN